MIQADFLRLGNLDVDIDGVRGGQARAREHACDQFHGTGRRTNLFYLLLEGEREYYIDGELAFRFQAGEMIFIPITSCYVSKVISGTSMGIYVDFNLAQDGEQIYLDEPFRIIPGAGYAEKMKTIASPGQTRLRAKAALYDILADIGEQERASSLAEGEFGSIYAAIRQLELHPEEPVDIGELARRCFMSETGFREKFKRYSGGLTPLEYRNRIRIDRADDLLRAESFTLERIADMLGFWDTAHFCRIYKKLRGTTPRGHR